LPWHPRSPEKAGEIKTWLGRGAGGFCVTPRPPTPPPPQPPFLVEREFEGRGTALKWRGFRGESGSSGKRTESGGRRGRGRKMEGKLEIVPRRELNRKILGLLQKGSKLGGIWQIENRTSRANSNASLDTYDMSAFWSRGGGETRRALAKNGDRGQKGRGPERAAGMVIEQKLPLQFEFPLSVKKKTWCFSNEDGSLLEIGVNLALFWLCAAVHQKKKKKTKKKKTKTSRRKALKRGGGGGGGGKKKKKKKKTNITGKGPRKTTHGPWGS